MGKIFDEILAEGSAYSTRSTRITTHSTHSTPYNDLASAPRGLSWLLHIVVAGDTLVIPRKKTGPPLTSTYCTQKWTTHLHKTTVQRRLRDLFMAR